VLRRATAADADAIAELYERSYATLDYLPKLHTLAEHRAFMAKHVEEDDVWVWEEPGGILGFMVLRPTELFLLYLDPTATGRGIGTRLLEHAKARRPDGFTLWTFQRNVGARRFYERHGLRAIEFGDGSGNEEGVPDVRYEWRPPAGRAPRGR
jgi:GNAT superfamily N-acetyltransferase